MTGHLPRKEHAASASPACLAHPAPLCSIVVFGNDSCPFCTELERTLNDRAGTGKSGQGTSWSYYRLNRLDNGAALRQRLQQGTGQSSVPYVFVDGKLIGGTDDLKNADYKGTQPGVLSRGAVAADADAPARCSFCVITLVCTVKPGQSLTSSLHGVCTRLVVFIARAAQYRSVESGDSGAYALQCQC